MEPQLNRVKVALSAKEQGGSKLVCPAQVLGKRAGEAITRAYNQFSSLSVTKCFCTEALQSFGLAWPSWFAFASSHR